MATGNSAQDVIICSACATSAAEVSCVDCHVNLCNSCAVKHVLDFTDKDYHKSIPLRPRVPAPDYPKCQTHPYLVCDRHCQQCDTPVCENCVSSTVHKGHNLLDLKTALKNKKEGLHRDLQELESHIYPKYQEIESTIPEIIQSIADLKALMDSNDISLVSAYKSRNDEFKNLPFNKFSPQKANGDKIDQQNGSPSLSSFTTEQDTTKKTQEAGSSPKKRPLLGEPRIITDIKTGYKDLHSVACLDDEKIWTSGLNKTMKLFNLRGDLLKSKDTIKSTFAPLDISVTKGGDLVYANYKEGTVNILMKDSQKQVVITMQNWKPRNVCSTFSGDLLVVMVSDAANKSKIVRYSGSNEQQSIQFDDRGQPLFSLTISSKYISENRNLDICVSDSGANAVVVVNQAGKLRFTYNGPPSATKKPFQPTGITTDSQGRILTADSYKHRIHILDQDGQFLRYIDNCQLHTPWGLCMDTRDNIFVAEYSTGIVKKIQYCT